MNFTLPHFCGYFSDAFFTTGQSQNLVHRSFTPLNGYVLVLLPGVDSITNSIYIAREAKKKNKDIILLGSHTLNTYKLLCSNDLKTPGCDCLKGLILPVPWNPDGAIKFLEKQDKFWNVKTTWRSVMSYKATKSIETGLQQLITERNINQAELSKYRGELWRYINIDSAEPELGQPSLLQVQTAKNPTDRMFDFVTLTQAIPNQGGFWLPR